MDSNHTLTGIWRPCNQPDYHSTSDPQRRWEPNGSAFHAYKRKFEEVDEALDLSSQSKRSCTKKVPEVDFKLSSVSPPTYIIGSEYLDNSLPTYIPGSELLDVMLMPVPVYKSMIAWPTVYNPFLTPTMMQGVFGWNFMAPFITQAKETFFSPTSKSEMSSIDTPLLQDWQFYKQEPRKVEYPLESWQLQDWRYYEHELQNKTSFPQLQDSQYFYKYEPQDDIVINVDDDDDDPVDVEVAFINQFAEDQQQSQQQEAMVDHRREQQQIAYNYDEYFNEGDQHAAQHFESEYQPSSHEPQVPVDESPPPADLSEYFMRQYNASVNTS